MRRRLTALLTALPLLLCACGTTAPAVSSTAPETTAPPPPPEYTLVTLGDSISYGYGLDNPGEQRYSALLAAQLSEADSAKWNDCNYAVSGDDSTDLIKRLNDGKALRLPSADSIVICIGANNLLGVYTAFLSDIAGNVDFDPADFTEENQEELKNKIQDSLADKEKLAETMQKKIDENLDRLTSDMETIYAWIRERNDTASVYILNIYNPYSRVEDSTFTIPNNSENFGDYAQSQIDRANSILLDFTKAHDDLTFVDIAAPFAAQETVPIIGAQEGAQYPDPHPTVVGQEIIADTVYEAMRGQ